MLAPLAARSPHPVVYHLVTWSIFPSSRYNPVKREAGAVQRFVPVSGTGKVRRGHSEANLAVYFR